MTLSKYKPHIDGLRAIAVLLVILHHLGDWLGTRGGYIGVDVFFVISGYLITTIVRADIELGQFRFSAFYKRRVIRLAPAYFSVLIATTIAAFFWMLPGELVAYARSMIAASLFAANFHMWTEVGGYFGGDAMAVPLLHLWSLAVEEQFYVVWPFILLIGHRLLSGRRMLYAVAVVVVLGVVASQVGLERAPAAAYYLLPTRFFELATGAFLAYLPVSTLSQRLATWASFAGLGLISYAAWSFDRQTPFPGYAAALPVLGTAMLLRWAEGTLVGAWLGNRLAILIGRISYPAYLWHWPMLVFLHINEIPITIEVGVAVLATTFALSWLTHLGLELPVRRFGSHSPLRVLMAGALIPIAAVILIAASMIALKGLPARFPESLNRKSEAMLAFAHKTRGRCNEGPPASPAPPSECVLGRAVGTVDFLLVGDSHANHLTGFLDVLAMDAQLRGYDMTRSNTPYIPGVDLSMPNQPEYNRNFRVRNDYVSGVLARDRFRVVVLAGAYQNFYRGDLLIAGDVRGAAVFAQGMRDAIRKASAAAGRVVVFTSIPQLQDGLSDCTLRAERFSKELDCTTPADDHLAGTAGVRSLFDELKAEFPDVVWVEIEKLMCDEARCITEMDGIPLYRDGGHLNDVGSRLMARKWIERYGNPLNGQVPVDERSPR